MTRVFISSTYIDLKDVRNAVETCLRQLYFSPVCFERGGINYDHRKPMDQSCYDAVKECDMMILIIGGRYGSPGSSGVESSNGLIINSITKTEYLEALGAGIKVLTFIKESVLNEYYTFRNQPKKQRKLFKPAMVDDLAVYSLIHEILQLDRNNEIVRYENISEIVEKIQKDVALLAHKGLKVDQSEDTSTDVLVNAFKLFYNRRQKQMSLLALASKARVKRNFISSLENVRPSNFNDPSELPFRVCRRDLLARIEKVLECEGKLSCGNEDDMLSHYVNYYYANRGKPTTGNRRAATVELFPKKVIVFDFDGTLTRTKDRTTWEKIWVELGYTVNDCAFYHRQYNNGAITHEEWCKITCEKFQQRQMSEDILKKIAASIELIDGVERLIEILEDNKIEMHILSGSIDQIIFYTLGENLYKRFTRVQANSFNFTRGRLSFINGTAYDFEGKSTYLSNLLRQRELQPYEILFVGNSSNDRWASKSGVTTLCVNPHFTDGNDEKEWNYCLREMDSILEILQFIQIDLSNA